MSAYRIITLAVFLLSFRVTFCQFQANYVSYGHIGNRLERGSGRDLAMSGATISNHRSQYISFQNAALLSLNKITYVVSSNLQYRPEYSNPSDVRKFANIYASINRLAIYSTIVHNYSESSTTSNGNFASIRNGRIRENGIGFGYQVTQMFDRNLADLERTQEPRKLGRGYRPKSLHIGLNLGYLSGFLEEINPLSNNDITSVDTFQITNNRRIQPIAFIRQGMLFENTVNNRFELNIGMVYQYNFKGRLLAEQAYYGADAATTFLTEQGGTINYPDWYKIGVSYSRPYSRSFQWVLEITFEQQFFKNYDDFTVKESNGDYVASALGFEGKINGIIGRFGAKYAVQQRMPFVTTSLRQTVTSELKNSETLQFSIGTAISPIQNLLIDISLIQWFGKFHDETGAISKKFAELNVGLTILSAWFVPRSNLTS